MFNLKIFLCISFLILFNIPLIHCLPKLDGAGRGWDYLLDEGRQSIFKISYELEKTTGDEKFLIPDCSEANMDMITRYEPYAEIIESGSNYTSLTSKSYGLDAGANFKSLNLSFGFSYSKEYKDLISTQKQDKSVTVRIMFSQQRYIIYFNRRCPLNNFFIKDVENIIKSIQNNQTELATNLSQVLIKDYGTHSLTTVNFGGIIYKNDYIKQSYWNNMRNKAETVKKSASINFIPFSDKPSTATSSQQTINEYNEYNNNTVISGLVIARGGIYKPNAKFDDWIDSLEIYPADINRKGTLISDLISPDSFPNYGLNILYKTQKLIEASIISYLSINTKPGCMDRQSENFDFSANFNDQSSCKKSSSKSSIKFGGIVGIEYNCRSCSYGGLFSSTKCSSYIAYNKIINLVNSQVDCPSNYKSYSLFYENYCNGYNLMSLKQCASEEINNSFDGVYFGGIYSSKINNPLTGKPSCPQYFQTQSLLSSYSGAFICLSIKNEAKEYSIEFGGILSSNPSYSLNPWANKSLNCPEGFKKLYGFSIYSNEYYYCAKFPSIPDTAAEYISLPLIERPLVEDILIVNKAKILLTNILMLTIIQLLILVL